MSALPPKRVDMSSVASELDLVRPSRSTETLVPVPAPDTEVREDDPLAELDSVVGTPAEPEPEPRKRKRRKTQVGLKSEITVPEEILFSARSMVRPVKTGAVRSLGAAFVLQAYIQAVHETVDGVDVEGIGPENHDEMVSRVKAALRESF